jgi:hypothetical protein
MAGDVIVKWRELGKRPQVLTRTFKKTGSYLYARLRCSLDVHTRRELQDLSYKINLVNKRWQNLNRTPAVDEAAGVEI